MKTFKQHLNEEMLEATKDIKKYTVADFKKFGRAGRGFKTTVYVKFLYMDESDSGKEAGTIKGTDNRIQKEQQPTALYMTVNGPEPGGFLYPAGAYYVGHGRVNAVGEVVMAWTGTARLVTYNLKEAISYIKKFGNVSLQKKQIEKGTKGWDAWPTTYDTTGDFEGQGAGSKINRITNINSIKYK
tara:strand:+ start:255 stop:809 length:555 start_codon:yes stop_codon:yes gene_type:complete